MNSDNDVCVCCGVYVPEGTMICNECLKLIEYNKDSSNNEDNRD